MRFTAVLLAWLSGPALAQDVFVLGEVHDNPQHHLEQAARVAAIAPRALVFEMLTPEQAQAGAGVDWSDAGALGAALGWDETAWPDFAMYHPIFAAAPPDTALYGAALPRDLVRRAVTEGAAALLSETGQNYLRPVSDDERMVRAQNQHAVHCGALPLEILPGMVEAQRLRDAGLARIVARAVEDTGGPVALITGNGHARTDWGVPAVLAHARPDLEVFALGQVENDSAPEAPFDEVVSAPAPARADPCAAFR